MTRGPEFLLRAFAKGSELHKKLRGQLVLNASRVESFSEMKREIQDYFGMKQWLTPGAPEVMAVGSSKGNVEGEWTAKFIGQEWQKANLARKAKGKVKGKLIHSYVRPVD